MDIREIQVQGHQHAIFRAATLGEHRIAGNREVVGPRSWQSSRQLNLVHPGFLLHVAIWFCGSDRRRDSIDVQPNDNPS